MIYPLKVLRQEGHDLTGYFYNPNIHPYLEYKRRLDTLKDYAKDEGVPVLYDETYPMETFLRMVINDEENRCRYCYVMRLLQAAETARTGGFEDLPRRFSTANTKSMNGSGLPGRSRG